jgi:hypothetical protein
VYFTMARAFGQTTKPCHYPLGLSTVGHIPFVSAPDVKYVQEVLKVSPLWRELTREAEDRGRQEGREEGQRRLLAAQLTQRFGSLSRAVQARLAALPAEQLEALALRLVVADSLHDVLALLDHPQR